MKCRYCGNPIEADAKKCPSCLWEGDDLAVEDDAQVKEEEPKEEQEFQKDDLFEQATDANSENNEETTNSKPKEEKAPDNVVVGLTKKEFFDFYIPEKIRSNALWASYFLFASAIAFCFTAIFNFYYGVICSVVCLVLAVAIKKTLSIGPAIASCIFTILLTIVNFMSSQRITGWWAIVASIFCCTALSKFNSLWTIYSATSKVPTLDPIDKARSEARKNQKPNKAGWIVYYAALALCLVGVVLHYAFALSYISKFDFGTTEGNNYVNEFYDVDVTLSSDWYVYNSTDLADANEYTYGVAKPAAVDTQYLMYATTEKDEFVLIESYFIESLIYNSQDMADEFEELYSSGSRTCERLDRVEYNGNRYEVLYIEYEFEYEDTGEKGVYYDKLFTRTEGSYCVSIYVSTTEGAERLEDICAMIFAEIAE